MEFVAFCLFPLHPWSKPEMGASFLSSICWNRCIWVACLLWSSPNNYQCPLGMYLLVLFLTGCLELHISCLNWLMSLDDYLKSYLFHLLKEKVFCSLSAPPAPSHLILNNFLTCNDFTVTYATFKFSNATFPQFISVVCGMKKIPISGFTIYLNGYKIGLVFWFIKYLTCSSHLPFFRTF